MDLSPTIFTNHLSRKISQGLQHPEEVARRRSIGIDFEIDFETAVFECETHEESMRKAGAYVQQLCVNLHAPDGVFVQDNAYLLYCAQSGQWHAFGARMGHANRQVEVEPVLNQLESLGFVVHRFPEDNDGFIEYGDVFSPMKIDGSLYVFCGRRVDDSRLEVPVRTDDAGVSWFKGCVEELGYRFVEFEFRDTLHATSIGNAVGTTPNGSPLVLMDGSRCSLQEFNRLNIDTPQLEASIRKQHAWGLNTVRIDGSVIMQRGFTPVRELLYQSGFTDGQVIETPWTQLKKLDGSPSCRCISKVFHI